MDEVTLFVPFEEDLKHDRIMMRHGDNERVYVPERKRGIWTHEDAGVWICGVCREEVGEMGDEYGVPKYNFCPYCGADMKGV